MIGVDYGGEWWGFRHNSEPTEWIPLFICFEHIIGNGTSANPVKAVTTGDEFALNFILLTVFKIRDKRFFRDEIMRFHVLRLVDDLTTRIIPGSIEILGYLRLTVGGHFSACVFHCVDK